MCSCIRRKTRCQRERRTNHSRESWSARDAGYVADVHNGPVRGLRSPSSTSREWRGCGRRGAAGAAVLNMAMNGYSWWSGDVGGYFGATPNGHARREVLVHRFEQREFCPLFRPDGDRLPNTTTNPDMMGGPNRFEWEFLLGKAPRARPERSLRVAPCSRARSGRWLARHDA